MTANIVYEGISACELRILGYISRNSIMMLVYYILFLYIIQYFLKVFSILFRPILYCAARSNPINSVCVDSENMSTDTLFSFQIFRIFYFPKKKVYKKNEN